MKKISIIIIIFLMIFMLFNTSIVKATMDPGKYKPGDLSDDDISKVTSKAGPIIGTIKTVGIVISVIVMIVLGIKYMTGTVEERAEYKKTMIPYLIGVVLLVAITQFVGLIANIVSNIDA